jgi:hypothetical protein
MFSYNDDDDDNNNNNNNNNSSRNKSSGQGNHAVEPTGANGQNRPQQ